MTTPGTTYNGTKGKDTLTGGAGNDTMNGAGGADSLAGGDGDDSIDSGLVWNGAGGWLPDDAGDLLDGGAGADALTGGAGNDTMIGGSGNDTLYGAGGVDSLLGGDGDDRVESGYVYDTVSSSWKEDTKGDFLSGGAGNDTLYGSDGNDTLDGGSGLNVLQGGKGNDTYVVRSLDDRIYDEAGSADAGIIQVDWYKPAAGVENWTWAAGVQKLPYWIDSLTYSLHSLATEIGPTRVVHYHFAQAPASFFTADDKNDFSPFTADQISFTKRAFALLSSLFNLRFEEVSDPTTPYTIVMGNNFQATSGGYAAAIGKDGGSVLMVNKTEESVAPTKDGGGVFLTVLLHELGHSLGLKHPFAHADAAGDVGEGPFLPKAEDTKIWTTMSYTGDILDEPMAYSPLDIAALQYFYGPAATANAGDTRFVLKENATNMLYDGAGTDTIDGSGLGKALTLNLEPGYWGYIGSKADLISAPGQVTINFGSVIEHAIGSAFADSLTGNGAANLIDGGAGNDTLAGAGGNDTLVGGAGDDVASYGAALAGFALSRTPNGYAVRDKSGALGTDALSGIELLNFADLRVSLTVQGIAAASVQADVNRIVELYIAFFNRTPDAEGLGYWIGEFNRGKTVNEIAEIFYSVGAQYQSLTGFSATMSSKDFVNVVYRNVLGRKDGADAEALDYWSGRLDTGKDTHGSLVSVIVDTAHNFKGDKTWGWVADLLDNKIAVGRKVAIDWGLFYYDGNTAVSQGMAIASAVTPTDTAAALKLVGLADADILLG